MVINTKIDNKNNVRINTVSGLFDIHEIIKYIESLNQLNKSKLGMNVCWDLSKSDVSKVKATDVKQLIYNSKDIISKDKNKKSAIVVKEDADYGIARMFQLMLEDDNPSEVNIYKDKEEAMNWIYEQ